MFNAVSVVALSSENDLVNSARFSMSCTRTATSSTCTSVLWNTAWRAFSLSNRCEFPKRSSIKSFRCFAPSFLVTFWLPPVSTLT